MRLNRHLIVKVKPLTRSPMANPDPQNARPEGGSYLELWCCLLVFIEEIEINNKLLIFIVLVFSDRTQLVSARVRHSWCPHVAGHRTPQVL